MGDVINELSETDREIAWKRYTLLRDHLENAVPLRKIVNQSGISFRTAQYWVARYKKLGLVGLSRCFRKDRGTHRVIELEVKNLIEGLSLKRPSMSISTIHRKVFDWCNRTGIRPPSYSTVYGITKKIEPALITLSQEGTKVYKQAFDLLHRGEAEKQNDIWQADHMLLDIWIKDEKKGPE